jgi:hypothetical protein
MIMSTSPAWANHKYKPQKGPIVVNAFNGIAPPKHFECRWRDNNSKGKYIHAYVCTGSGNYRATLNKGGLLAQSQDGADSDVAKPGSFTCNRKGAGTKPSDVECSYRHKNGGKEHSHTFTMDQMVVMIEVETQEAYVWPPHIEK